MFVHTVVCRLYAAAGWGVEAVAVAVAVAVAAAQLVAKLS